MRNERFSTQKSSWPQRQPRLKGSNAALRFLYKHRFPSEPLYSTYAKVATVARLQTETNPATPSSGALHRVTLLLVARITAGTFCRAFPPPPGANGRCCRARPKRLPPASESPARSCSVVLSAPPPPAGRKLKKSSRWPKLKSQSVVVDQRGEPFLAVLSLLGQSCWGFAPTTGQSVRCVLLTGDLLVPVFDLHLNGGV